MIIKELLKHYDELPDIKCKGKCTDSCGPIVYGDVERRNIKDHHGKDGLPQVREDLTCNQLSKEGLCEIYEQRPLICRLFGIVKGLQCQHGCVPDAWLSEHLSKELMDKIIHGRSTTKFGKLLEDRNIKSESHGFKKSF